MGSSSEVARPGVETRHAFGLRVGWPPNKASGPNTRRLRVEVSNVRSTSRKDAIMDEYESRRRAVMEVVERLPGLDRLITYYLRNAESLQAASILPDDEE